MFVCGFLSCQLKWGEKSLIQPRGEVVHHCVARESDPGWGGGGGGVDVRENECVWM